MSKVSFVPTGGRPANVGVGVTRSRIVLKSESGARLGPSRPQTTPGGLSTAELTRGQGTTAFSFSREKREVASSNLVTTRDHFQRRPYLEYAEEAPDHGRKPPRFKGGSWAPLREEKPHNKLPAVDPDDFQPISRVVAAREAASSTSLRDLKRRKQQAKLKAYRPVPLHGPPFSPTALVLALASGWATKEALTLFARRAGPLTRVRGGAPSAASPPPKPTSTEPPPIEGLDGAWVADFSKQPVTRAVEAGRS
eukprot:CAMPEP_0172598976 /NCGR_PEP_ID=MMETSP1068-20121228/19093_1 /TAXON_ID=35684 /ORGANISM="Pseudopedinella elastica, Strain CCMP716" /LENGTH=251 /DNA_ID=CAMNT_0013399085 /DNA_START=77 /DNA_END=834 /DNA_ORIENTATION=-